MSEPSEHQVQHDLIEVEEFYAALPTAGLGIASKSNVRQFKGLSGRMARVTWVQVKSEKDYVALSYTVEKPRIGGKLACFEKTLSVSGTKRMVREFCVEPYGSHKEGLPIGVPSRRRCSELVKTGRYSFGRTESKRPRLIVKREYGVVLPGWQQVVFLQLAFASRSDLRTSVSEMNGRCLCNAQLPQSEFVVLKIPIVSQGKYTKSA
ncbi:hypothetical protein DFH09DRAFT_1103213 [Mycena vulgaris]|nr:hypothetical protein DFH09DRAFT_1103213 [Mycena vulgaris]